MVHIDLDEDSSRGIVQTNLIEEQRQELEQKRVIGNDQKPRIQGNMYSISRFIIQTLREYFSSLRVYVLDRYFSVKKNFFSWLKNAWRFTYSLKSYLVTKLFWGRGSLYRYVAFVSILAPVCISVFIVYTKINVPQNHGSIVISNAFINQVANNTNNISVEGKLVQSQAITASADAFTLYKVKENDTLASIAQQYNISSDILVWANGLSSDTLTPGQELIIFPAQGLVYTTKAGDTVASIAKTYKVSTAEIQGWNLIDDPSNPIPVGKKILIPGITSTTSTLKVKLANISSSPSPQCTTDPKVDPGHWWCYTQVDSRWSSMILGTYGQINKYSPYNIGNVGCLVTSVAMLTEYYYPQDHITPANIAYYPQNFVGGDLLVFSGFGLFNITPLGTVFGTVDWNAINQQLDLGHPVIVKTNGREHYVVLYARQGSDYIMNDPAWGGGLKFSQYYNKNYIYQAFLYTPIH